VALVLSVTIVAVVIACLLFGAWLVRLTGDPASLRDAAVFLKAIPHPRVTVRLPARRRPPSGSS
jgi:hypothetical protein